MKTILPGTMYFGKLQDLHCVLGSCVGVVIVTEDTIGITHGNLPENTADLINSILKDFVCPLDVTLAGGMRGRIGRANIKAAKKVLREHGIIYKDMTGKACKIVVHNGELDIKHIYK